MAKMAVLLLYSLLLDSVSYHKHDTKELGKYLAILTSRLVNNFYVFSIHTVTVKNYLLKRLFH